MNMPPEPGSAHPPERLEGFSSGSIATRILDATKKLLTITDHLRALEKEDDRLQRQVVELSRWVVDLMKEVRELSGQMKGIEKRFDDKDKMIEVLIQLRVSEEVEKAISRLAVVPQAHDSQAESGTRAAHRSMQNS